MAKNNAVGAESDDLGKVIKNLIDFDAKQRAIVSDSLKKRDEERKALEQSISSWRRIASTRLKKERMRTPSA